MVAVTRSLLALLLCQALLGGAAGLMPEVGRRRFSEPSRAASAAQRPEDLLSEFELRLLHMFGLKRRPSPGKDVVIPPYMLDLYRLHAGQQLGQPAALGFPLERAASRANTVRSFHHEGTGGRGLRGLRERRGGQGRRRSGGRIPAAGTAGFAPRISRPGALPDGLCREALALPAPFSPLSVRRAAPGLLTFPAEPERLRLKRSHRSLLSCEARKRGRLPNARLSRAAAEVSNPGLIPVRDQ